MAEPQVQYAKTSDGVSIAFWTMGDGMPLVDMPPFPFKHLQLEWQIPEFRQWHERLAERWKVVRFDPRGVGLSDRNATDFSLSALMLDLEAVLERLGLARLAVLGGGATGPLAISYAARHAERVSHLILYNSYARASDLMGTAQAEGLLALMESDWELFTETLAHVGFGWSTGEPAHRYAALVRDSITPEQLQAYIVAFAEVDVTNLLPQVQCPTLVLQSRTPRVVDAAKDLVSRIPDARWVLLEGVSVFTSLGDRETAANAIDEFLGDGQVAAGKPESVEPGAFRTILFTDMEGSTSLTQKLGDAAAQELLRTHNRIVRDSLKSHSGTETKHTGDGIMASFTSASAALEASVAIQKALADHNEDKPDAAIRVRIGLNAGEPVAEEEDLFGTAVQLAARVCDKAEPGQILVADVVQQLAAGKRFTFTDKGEAMLKGFEKPVRLHEVRWHD